MRILDHALYVRPNVGGGKSREPAATSTESQAASFPLIANSAGSMLLYLHVSKGRL